MAIKKQTIEVTVTYDEETISGKSAMDLIADTLLDEGVIEFDYELKNEEILPDEDFIDED